MSETVLPPRIGQERSAPTMDANGPARDAVDAGPPPRSEPAVAPARLGRFWRDLQATVARAVVGELPGLRLLCVALLADGHALIEDVPGVGKTLVARAFARALGLAFTRIQGTPDLLPTDVTGAAILDGGRLRFMPGPIFTNVLLVDEINRATPRTQSALLEAMQERQVSVEGETRPLANPFLVVATQNPVELEGTFSLPEAQLDRFLVQIRLGYPDREEERRIARRYRGGGDPLEQVEPVVDRDTLAALRQSVSEVHVSEAVEGYLVDLVRATRAHRDLRLGGSPRASVSLYRASQAWAALDGRGFVLPDDVVAVAGPVLAHRLRLDVDRQLRGATVEGVLAEILSGVPAPVVEP